MNGHLLEILAREKAQMPEAWQVFRFECLPHGEPTIYYELTGAIVPLKTKGDGKGQPNWRKMDKATKRRVVMSIEAADALAAAWSLRTGLCINCTGSGKTLMGWSKASGREYQPCKDCDGTGNRKPTEAPR